MITGLNTLLPVLSQQTYPHTLGSQEPYLGPIYRLVALARSDVASQHAIVSLTTARSVEPPPQQRTLLLQSGLEWVLYAPSPSYRLSRSYSDYPAGRAHPVFIAVGGSRTPALRS